MEEERRGEKRREETPGTGSIQDAKYAAPFFEEEKEMDILRRRDMMLDAENAGMDMDRWMEMVGEMMSRCGAWRRWEGKEERRRERRGRTKGNAFCKCHANAMQCGV